METGLIRRLFVLYSRNRAIVVLSSGLAELETLKFNIHVHLSANPVASCVMLGRRWSSGFLNVGSAIISSCWRSDARRNSIILIKSVEYVYIVKYERSFKSSLVSITLERRRLDIFRFWTVGIVDNAAVDGILDQKNHDE